MIIAATTNITAKTAESHPADLPVEISVAQTMDEWELGMPPEQLARSLKNGDLSRALKNMPAAQQQMLKKALTDKAACQRLMDSPQAQALLKKFSGK